MPANHKPYDAIVVGTGPGGATVAKELSEKKQKVLILERGDNWRVRGTSWQALLAAGIPGRSLLLTHKALAMVRGITTGGSSLFYYATAFEPPVTMLKKHGLDIAAEVKEVRHELPIAPLADELVGPGATRIMASARELGYRWQKLPKFIYQDKCQAACWRCNYGCPFGAKWDARHYVDQAVAKGATLINRAKVEKVLVENNRATGVIYRRWGSTVRARAPRIVLAAGGIGSPVILRKSGIDEAGYDFFFDPLISVMGTVKGLEGGREIPMATGLHMEEEGYVMTDMTVPRALYLLLTGEVLRFDKLFSHGRTLQIMIKARDRLGGRVTGSGGVRKRLAAGDRDKLLNGYSRARKILENAGATGIYKSWYIAAHPGGTAKVGEVVDANLETRYHNLYVCDCSVIPEAWGLPPTFTLLALGKRLVKHMSASA
jgi:choline dehydrogenase-like flavoprotein